MVAYVYRDGSRLTPWMLYQINRMEADLTRRFPGVRVLVTSGIRTNADQRRIFFDRYVTASNVRGRRVYDTRWFEGRLWYRVSPAGTVAVPGTSNHEVQGSRAAVDLRDTGRDAGIATRGSARSNWLRANAPKYDMVASGFGFGEAWHYDVNNIYKSPPAQPAGEVDVPKEDTVKAHYYRQDRTAREGGRTVKPGGGFWLHTEKGVATSQASNIVGGIGAYSFVTHVYAEGTPGDAVDVVLKWDNTRTAGEHSPHYVEHLVIPEGGVVKASIPALRAVSAGYAVYARLDAAAKNAKPVKVTVFDTDAYLFS